MLAVMTVFVAHGGGWRRAYWLFMAALDCFARVARAERSWWIWAGPGAATCHWFGARIRGPQRLRHLRPDGAHQGRTSREAGHREGVRPPAAVPTPGSAAEAPTVDANDIEP